MRRELSLLRNNDRPSVTDFRWKPPVGEMACALRLPSENRPSLRHVMRPDSPTLAGGIGKATPGARRPSTSLSTWGPFPRPALPGVSSTTDPSATPPAQPAPHGGPVDAYTSPTGRPMLLRLPSSRHADASTPAGAARCFGRLPSRTASGLPPISGGSSPATPVSRPAQRTQVFRPACSLNCSTHPFDTGVLQYMSLPLCTAPAATNRNDKKCVGFSPTRKTRLSTAHQEIRAIALSGSTPNEHCTAGGVGRAPRMGG